jgi:hypothetical protein
MSGNLNDALLARLMAQAEGRGVELVTLRALVEEASQSGATRALGALGLDDTRARRDMDELRELLSAWRDAKRSAGKAIVTWFVGGCPRSGRGRRNGCRVGDNPAQRPTCPPTDARPDCDVARTASSHGRTRGR